jgi:hypothetical protein
MIVHILIAWVVLSFPAGMLFGRLMAHVSERYPELGQ